MLFQGISKKDRTRLEYLVPGYENDFSPSSGVIFGSIPWPFQKEFLKLRFYAGEDERKHRKRANRIIIITSVAFILFVALQQGFWLLLIPASLLNEYFKLSVSIETRIKSFEKDYTALLLSLTSAVRTGMDPLSAFIHAKDLFPDQSEIHREIALFQKKLEQGASQKEAIQGFAESIRHPDIRLFRTAMLLAIQEGSSLSACLQRLARVTRQRQSFRRRVRSAVAMQKMSAFGICACTVAILLVQSMAHPKAILEAWQNPIGFRALSSGGVLIVSGMTWMLHMTRRRY